MTKNSRETMISSAAELMGSRGMSGTSFSDVLEHSGAPRGSIYHHFPGGKQELAKAAPGLIPAMVSEAGASVYSASEEASKELPDLDVSIRGAVSIARRLQDPLAELVKIDPKSIGVGQYQHDVSATMLSRSLDGVVEDCVNAVGVDVNTASAPLLRRVSGISSGLATTIVGFRDEHGPFASRKALTKVPRLGAKAFEQCAGFLRIRGGDDPLDVSGVHPEAYPVVRRILARAKTDIGSLIGNGVPTKLSSQSIAGTRASATFYTLSPSTITAGAPGSTIAAATYTEGGAFVNPFKPLPAVDRAFRDGVALSNLALDPFPFGRPLANGNYPTCSIDAIRSWRGKGPTRRLPPRRRHPARR